MNQETFWKEFSALPTKAQTDQDAKIIDDPFIGMWKDRADIVESTEYVRALRLNEWGFDPSNN